MKYAVPCKWTFDKFKYGKRIESNSVGFGHLFNSLCEILSLQFLYIIPSSFALTKGPFCRKYLPTSSIILYFSFLCGFDSTKTFFSKSMKLFCKCPSTCTLRFRLLFLENSFPRLWCHSLDSIGKITALVFFSLTLHSELLLT